MVGFKLFSKKTQKFPLTAKIKYFSEIFFSFIYLQTTTKDITNQTLSNIIRQLSCLASFAEEILGDAGNALANQNARIYNLSNRIEQLDAKVQILNPKQIGM